MLSEIVLTPDVFDGACYSSPDACDIHLTYLKEPLLIQKEVLVRDLRDGEWVAHLKNQLGRWHPRGKELFKKLITQNRLRPFRAVVPATPTDDDGWCVEAVAAHGVEAVEAIVASKDMAIRHAGCPVVCSVERVTSSAWWRARSPSVRPERTVASYLQHLRLVLHSANSFMFIDPHLDPSRARYADFIQILLALQRPRINPYIEIHRVCYEWSGRERVIFTGTERARLEQRFRKAWRAVLLAAGLTVTVYVWSDFHDRYLITDLVGINLNNGFDQGRRTGEKTMWTRLGRSEADDVQREFHPAAATVKPYYSFVVP